eukprot:c14913_g1_i1.p1 GENE.c14913_g1_i1~~c14913_g1_i1.p1  ORF type:complete len:353 (-),score=40.61 c14913_g1_i1:297-1319(-)
MVLSFILPAFVNYWWTWLCLMVGTMTLYTYFVPLLISTWLHAEQNLKTKYNADWAVVTGASSGIGRAIAEKLASQGINVVVVALEEPLLDEVMTALNDKFGPEGVQFRRVGANLGQAPEAYMPALTAATADILPKLIFNNAGFVVTGLFADSPLGRQMANYHCNATAPVVITHHFANRLLDAKVPGGICFTSSPAGFMPTPLTSTYASTKAFLTTFAASIAPELRPDGIDVLVVHPSPVDTAFYTGATHMAAMRMAQRASYAPTAIASSFFRSRRSRPSCAPTASMCSWSTLPPSTRRSTRAPLTWPPCAWRSARPMRLPPSRRPSSARSAACRSTIRAT